MAENRRYLCIDLKSFYASVECVERGLDPMTTNLVVADPERSEKTICLAVSPSMKAQGVKNRCRVFEIPKNVEYIMAPPRMQKYIDYAAYIYGVYLQYISKDDIFVYSIDEVFMDVTCYLDTYKCTARELAVKLMGKVLEGVGVRAACGIGTNLYLAKIALDITAKKSPDFIGYLDEEIYRKTLWDHKPLTDFWRIGKGIAKHLAKYGIYTMKQIANTDEDFLYREFGIDAELLIDHAWGREPVTIAHIKAYKPKTNSISSGQVLMRDYSFDEGKLIVREMMDLLCLDLVDKELVTNSVTIYVGYSNALKADPAKGTAFLERETNSDSIILPAVVKVYEQIVDRNKPVRRISISCNNLQGEQHGPQQLSLFEEDCCEDEKLERDNKKQKAVIELKKRFGKNAIIRGMNLEEASTTIERNQQIGGHKSGE
ncbi:MAG TPA: DNA repair protein [Clostridiales bacterium]|nr:DNA repair protein [Clostridiales bacterium]